MSTMYTHSMRVRVYMHFTKFIFLKNIYIYIYIPIPTKFERLDLSKQIVKRPGWVEGRHLMHTFSEGMTAGPSSQ